MPKIDNIALVHGGFVDGAGWRGVYDILKKDGFNVSIVHNPTISLAGVRCWREQRKICARFEPYRFWPNPNPREPHTRELA